MNVGCIHVWKLWRPALSPRLLAYLIIHASTLTTIICIVQAQSGVIDGTWLLRVNTRSLGTVVRIGIC